MLIMENWKRILVQKNCFLSWFFQISVVFNKPLYVEGNYMEEICCLKFSFVSPRN